MRPIIYFFINSNIWVACCVLGLAFSIEILLEAANYKISQFVFCSTIFAYNFQRLVRLKKGHDHFYKDWIESNRKLIYILMILAGGVSGHLFFGFKFSTQIAILLAGVISLLYPFLLRKIPFAKIFIVSFIWAVSTMLLLVLENDILISENIIWQFISLFMFVFAITIPFDIRDVEYDLQNLKTMPLFFGVKRAKHIAFFALLICGLISWHLHFKMFVTTPNLLALISLYILACIFIQKSDKNNGKMYFSFLGESLSFCSYFLLVISESIF